MYTIQSILRLAREGIKYIHPTRLRCLYLLLTYSLKINIRCYILFCSAKVMSEREDVPADFFSIATSSQVHLSPFAAQTRRQQPASQRRRGLAYITTDDSSRRRGQKAGRSSAEQTAVDDGEGEMQPAPAWLAVLGTQIHVLMYGRYNPLIK
jgi:hypothetical protein